MTAINGNAAPLGGADLAATIAQAQQLMGTLGIAGGGATAAAPAAGAQGATAAAGTAAATGTSAPLTVPGTGQAQALNIQGVGTKYFAAAPVGTPAKEITAYQYAEKNVSFKVDLDYREGIAAGLSNLGNIFSARQERIRLLSNALANDANNGTINAADMARLQAENSTTEQLSLMQKKIFDSVQNAIQAWLR
ncbi:MAG: hypothetical protein JWM25_499 [Thermoleophilia bacterium]|nr:hypothetical protein [Thermoleophilia bacterium]MCZ4495916.1 hypothetical protein [Thermoleophilia bacterium]